MGVTIEEVIKTRRTIHLYEEIDIDDSLLNRFLEAGHFAPNHKLTWPWRFTVVGQEGRAKIADRAVELKSEGRTLTDGQVSKIGRKYHAKCSRDCFAIDDRQCISVKRGLCGCLMCYPEYFCLRTPRDGGRSGARGESHVTLVRTRSPVSLLSKRRSSDFMGRQTKVTPAIKRPDFDTVCRRVP